MSTCVKMIIAVSIALPAAAWAQSDARTTDTRAVAAALSQYKDAIEKLDAAGTEQLFTTDARVFETGASEGSYATYLAHHLGPELKQFKSFRFSDYKVDVRFEGSVALATETYRYRGRIRLRAK